MTVLRTLKNDELTVQLIGRLETVTAPKLEKQLGDSLQGVKTLIMDMTELEYISSEGVRVLCSVQKTMNEQGRMIVRNVNEDVMDVFAKAGAVDVLMIERA